MNCEAYIILLDEYLNDELDTKLRASVSAHLDGCGSCRAESRLLKIESSFYQTAARHDENNFQSDWETMRRQLAASTLADEIQSRAARRGCAAALIARFFAGIENPFSARKPVFGGAFLLIAIGASTLLLLNSEQNEAIEEAVSASVEKIAAHRPEDKVFKNGGEIQNEPEPVRETFDENSRTPAVKPSSISAAAVKRNSGSIAAVKRAEIVDPGAFRTGNSVKAEKTDFSPVGSPPGAKNAAAFDQPAKDERQLADYLNEVHLFLLMFRNLENDRTINAVIGDKYQTEARAFLRRNGDYKQASRRRGNIPAVELLNEIEPLLREISVLDEQNGNDRIGGVSAMVKQTGIVFKIRLWMSNARAGRSVRGGEKR